MSKTGVLETLLSEIENVKDANRLRKALGLAQEAEQIAQPQPSQPKVAPEFPCWRTKIAPDGKEISRKLCQGLHEVTACMVAGFHYSAPINEPLPEGSMIVTDEEKEKETADV